MLLMNIFTKLNYVATECSNIIFATFSFVFPTISARSNYSMIKTFYGPI